MAKKNAGFSKIFFLSQLLSNDYNIYMIEKVATINEKCAIIAYSIGVLIFKTV